VAHIDLTRALLLGLVLLYDLSKLRYWKYRFFLIYWGLQVDLVDMHLNGLLLKLSLSLFVQVGAIRDVPLIRWQLRETLAVVVLKFLHDSRILFQHFYLGGEADRSVRGLIFGFLDLAIASVQALARSI
jgi:hypothetical protein